MVIKWGKKSKKMRGMVGAVPRIQWTFSNIESKAVQIKNGK